MYSKHKVGVVIPALNEEVLIQRTITSIPEYVDKIYVIDDGSTDETLKKIGEAMTDRITILVHGHNRGVGAAISTGYKAALVDGMEIVAVMAGDNQMDPKYLSRLLDPIVWNMADYTKGNRLIGESMRRDMPKLRYVGNSILTWVTKASSGFYRSYDPQNGYSAISSKALREINLDDIYPRYGYCNDLLAKLNVIGCRVVDVMIPARYGEEKSKIKYGRYIAKVSYLLAKTFLWRLYTKYIVFDFHPLVFFYVGSAVLMLLGVVGALYSVYAKLFLHTPLFVNGVLSALLLMSGVQSLAFAIIFDMRESDESSKYTTLNGIRSGRVKLK